MKLRTLSTCLFVFFGLAALVVPAIQAQTPQQIAYQGYLTDAGGVPVDEAAVTLTFRLYDAAQAGRALWVEEHAAVTVDEGVFSVRLGAVGGLGNVSFQRPLWLSVAVGDRAADELTPRVALAAVPYALQGAEAQLAHDLAADAVGIVQSSHLAAGAVAAQHLAAGAVGADQLTDEAVATRHLADGAVTLPKIDVAGSAGEALVADGQGSATWGAVTGTWDETTDAFATDRKVAIGLPSAPNVPSSGLEMVGRLRIRQRADLNRGSLLVRPSYSAQDASSRMRLGVVADTSSTTLIGGLEMEVNPDASGDIHGTTHLVSGRQLPNGGVVWGRRITILHSGQVGIGEQEPAEQLHVDGDVLADEYLTPSDARLKREVETFDDAGALVQLLRGVTFHWKDRDRAEGARQIGFIAQEVEQVLPEVVQQDADGFYKVAYAKLVPVLVEAFKEQQQEVDALRDELRALRAHLQSGRAVPASTSDRR